MSTFSCNLKGEGPSVVRSKKRVVKPEEVLQARDSVDYFSKEWIRLESIILSKGWRNNIYTVLN
jgi:hypothetical protein